MNLGQLLSYAILRNDAEIFRHTDALSLVDDNAIQPYNVYRYQLEVCNTQGCTKSSEVKRSPSAPPLPPQICRIISSFSKTA